MSCGNPHDTPCSEVLARLYVYLDGELEPGGCSEIRQHLDECGPCLQEYDLEEVVKKLVGKTCGCDPVPTDLRAKVLGRIQQVRIAIESGQIEISQTSAEITSAD